MFVYDDQPSLSLRVSTVITLVYDAPYSPRQTRYCNHRYQSKKRYTYKCHERTANTQPTPFGPISGEKLASNAPRVTLADRNMSCNALLVETDHAP